jgi:hypothetical protein
LERGFGPFPLSMSATTAKRSALIRRRASEPGALSMVAGRSGYCERDPFLSDSSNAFAYQPKHPLSKSARKPVEAR